MGGVFRHVRDLAEAQHASGHEVGILCDINRGGRHDEALLEALRPSLRLGLTRLPMRRAIGVTDFFLLQRALTAIRQMRPDILHGHGAKGGVVARICGGMLRRSGAVTASLYAPHGGSLHYDGMRGRLVSALERLSECGASHLLFVCAYEREQYRRKVGDLRRPFSTVPNGLADAEFAPVPTQTNAADFLFVGEIRHLKGWDLFLQALASCTETAGKAPSAVMVGSGREVAGCRKRAAAQGVALLPPMPARLAFALARCVVVPSRAEALPYIVLEALAAARPVIATNVGGIPEIFGDSAGSLCEPEASSLAESMQKFLSDPEGFARAMPDREYLRGIFRISTMAARIEDAYRDSLAALTHS